MNPAQGCGVVPGAVASSGGDVTGMGIGGAAWDRAVGGFERPAHGVHSNSQELCRVVAAIDCPIHGVPDATPRNSVARRARFAHSWPYLRRVPLTRVKGCLLRWRTLDIPVAVTK